MGAFGADLRRSHFRLTKVVFGTVTDYEKPGPRKLLKRVTGQPTPKPPAFMTGATIDVSVSASEEYAGRTPAICKERHSSAAAQTLRTPASSAQI